MKKTTKAAIALIAMIIAIVLAALIAQSVVESIWGKQEPIVKQTEIEGPRVTPYPYEDEETEEPDDYEYDEWDEEGPSDEDWEGFLRYMGIGD